MSKWISAKDDGDGVGAWRFLLYLALAVLLWLGLFAFLYFGTRNR